VNSEHTVLTCENDKQHPPLRMPSKTMRSPLQQPNIPRAQQHLYNSPFHHLLQPFPQQRIPQTNTISATMESLERILRSLLTPITHHLPAPIQNTATSLIGASCYRSLVTDITITDTTCLKFALSKVAGVGIVTASTVVKIPQLLKLLNSQSAEGISFLSYLLETGSYLVSLAYNLRHRFPFGTYGETAFILVQNVAIAVLVLQYSGRGAGAAVFVAGLAAVGYALMSEAIVSADLLATLTKVAAVVGVASKVPQVVDIYRQGGTGQLSAFAVCSLSLSLLSLHPHLCTVSLTLLLTNRFSTT
jgi:mannose-P-dolichol utilization defect protein 1